MLFLATTAVMSLSVTEDLRNQRNKILPVSFLMLLVATLVRTPLSRTFSLIKSAIIIAHRPFVD